MDVSRKGTSRTLSATGLIFGLLFTINGCNACQPTEDELVESKYYRSEIVVQATVSTRGEDAVATVERTLKIPDNETVVGGEIKLTGFGTEDPCFWETTDLSENAEYFLFLGEKNEDEFYPIVANPVESSNDARKNIRKFTREGAAPTFSKQLKDKVFSPGDHATLSCYASGYPSPSVTMTKDGVTLSKGAVKGIRYKSGKGGIRLKFKNMQKELHEGVYACIADNHVHPQIMTSAAIEICTLTCSHGELNLKQCQCECEDGWNGLQCSIPLEPASPAVQPCNLNCGEHGRVASDECRCHCDGDYTGETCDVLCDKTCDTHGTLDRDTCTCQCENGYYGDTCSSTADELCNAGEFCMNGGTCYQVDDPKTRELLSICRCADGFIGGRCELESDITQCNINCSPYGVRDAVQCRCICDADHRGMYCQSLRDDHTEPCGPKYEHYCMNGGICIHLKGIMRPSCRCPMLFYGHRCDRIEPNPDCGCLNGGECQFNETKREYQCICPTHFGGTRCQFVKPGYSRNTHQSTQKMVITLCVIFVAMLMVIGLVVIVYIRNRNAREKERRERLEQLIREQRNGMRLRASLQSTGAGGSYPADDIEMTNFRPAATQQPDVKVEKEGTASMPSNPSQDKGSLPRSRGNSANGNSQTRLHSNGKQTGGEKGVENKKGKGGYESVPTEEEKGAMIEDPKKGSGASSPEGPGDPDTLPLKHPRASSDLGSDSEESDGEGDAVDVPNPQIQAIQSHLGSDHDSGDYTWDEHSSPGLRVTAPYPPQDMSPSHQPRGRGRLPGASSRPADHVNIHENPMENTGAKTDAMNNVMSSPKDAYYADRLKDVVEGSPPSAV